jgi:hypothetical protein
LNASAIYPELDFWLLYENEGAGSCGIYHVKNGAVLKDEVSELKYMLTES